MVDKKVLLLRIVPVHKVYFTYINYDRLHFLPISQSKTSILEINLRDTRGDLLLFELGNPTVFLHLHDCSFAWKK